ncbi:hypothetical protein EST55_03960 [Idiomarina sp. 29L]|uniref:hypothetical protein n=1 Tax=Idiomarina sp. 29L TaxID=2508877 RepID=UPI001012ECF2|nr:hypothetical protein [Idiomarina sp. 29L]RXS42917.1 hypothetical protein EST55_03960 [Idiomarina sp. 29L]
MSKHDNQTKTEDGASMHAYERSRRDADCGVSQEAQKGQGANPCNTAPPKYTLIEVFNQGIDSLYLSYSGALSKERNDELERLKLLAQSSSIEEKACAYMHLCDMDFVVQRMGYKQYSYVIRNSLFRIRIASMKAPNLPVAYVEISSELLNVSGFESALAISDSIVAELVGEPRFPKISRIDICADFSCPVDWSTFKENQWVCRSKKKQTFHENGVLTGFMFGAGGEISARLYDKTQEIVASKKDFFKDIWRESGWSGENKIWRLEFQLRQSVVKELGLLEPHTFMENINSVWAYGTQKWLKLRHDNGDKNPSRWPLEPVWTDLSQVRFNLNEAKPARRLSAESVPSREWLIINTLGSLTSYMATRGLHDPIEALNCFLEDADEFFRENQLRDFSSAQKYIEAKIEEKTTKYCLVSQRAKEQGDE